MKIQIDVKFGSGFQRDLTENLIQAFLISVKNAHDSRHKKNTFEYKIEEEKEDPANTEYYSEVKNPFITL